LETRTAPPKEETSEAEAAASALGYGLPLMMDGPLMITNSAYGGPGYNPGYGASSIPDPYAQQQQYPMQPPPATGYNAYDSSYTQAMDYTQAPPPKSSQDDDDLRAIAERTEARERAQAAQAAAKGGAGQPMRIRNDYVPRAQAKRQNATMALCPNCKTADTCGRIRATHED